VEDLTDPFSVVRMIADRNAEILTDVAALDPFTAAASSQIPVHFHQPATPLSERYVNGLRYVVFACECGETLPERRA